MKNVFSSIRQRWHAEGGYRQVLLHGSPPHPFDGFVVRAELHQQDVPHVAFPRIACSRDARGNGLLRDRGHLRRHGQLREHVRRPVSSGRERTEKVGARLWQAVPSRCCPVRSISP